MRNTWFTTVERPAPKVNRPTARQETETSEMRHENCANLEEAVQRTWAIVKAQGFRKETVRIVHAWEDGYC